MPNASPRNLLYFLHQRAENIVLQDVLSKSSTPSSTDFVFTCKTGVQHKNVGSNILTSYKSDTELMLRALGHGIRLVLLVLRHEPLEQPLDAREAALHPLQPLPHAMRKVLHLTDRARITTPPEQITPFSGVIDTLDSNLVRSKVC